MGGALATASATVSASVLATCNPQLHAKMQTAFSNSMAATANMHTDLELKAFSDNYVKVTSAGNTHVQIAGGSIGMLLMGIILTGNLRAFMAFLLLLLLCIAGCTVHAMSMKAKAEEMAASSMPAKQTEVALLPVEEKMTATVFQQVMKLSDVSKFEKDPSCAGIAQFMISIVRFQLSFKKMSYFRDDDGRKVQATSGKPLPKDLKGLTTTEVGERLYDKMRTAGNNFCSSFQHLQRLMTKDLEYLDMQLAMRQASKSDDPLDEARLRKRFRLEQLEQTVDSIRTDYKPLISEAEVYLKNVYRCNKVEASTRALLDEMVEKQESLQEKKRKIKSLQQEEAKLSSEQAKFTEKKRHAKQCEKGLEETVRYLERQLEASQQGLDAATRDEKNYTWWMFGPGSFVWQNDVALAKEKIKRFGQQKADLEKKIADMKSGKAEPEKEVHKELSEIDAELAGLQRKLANLQADLKAACAAAKQEEDEIAKKMQKVQAALDAEGKESVKHLMLAREALNEFAEAAVADADAAGLIMEDWSSEILTVKDFVEDIVEAPTLKDQHRIVWKLRQLLRRNRIPVLNMIQQAHKFTLSPGTKACKDHCDLPGRFGKSIADLEQPARKEMLLDQPPLQQPLLVD